MENSYSFAGFVFSIRNASDIFKQNAIDYSVLNKVFDESFSIFFDDLNTWKRPLSPNNYAYYENPAIYRKIAEWLPLHDAFVLHSACFDVDGVGVAFAAHSGTGKTTHMLLWQKLLGDRMTIVNGDKPIVRFFDEEAHSMSNEQLTISNEQLGMSNSSLQNDHSQLIYAYGTPWNGKEHLGCNMRTPLKHICFIERAEQNSCQPMDRSDAINRIMNQVYMPSDPAALLKTMQLIDRLINSCQLWLIRCNMEPEAAQIAFQTIFN